MSKQIGSKCLNDGAAVAVAVAVAVVGGLYVCERRAFCLRPSNRSSSHHIEKKKQ